MVDAPNPKTATGPRVVFDHVAAAFGRAFPRRGSIATSLALLSAGWLVVALVATAFLLTELYSRALDTSLTETLEFHIESLTDQLLLSDSPKNEAIRVADPRFDRTGSGWYWAVRDDKGELLNFSTSYIGTVLTPPGGAFDASNSRTEVVTDPFGIRIRMIEREVKVSGVPLRILVTGSLDEILQLVDDFRGQTLIDRRRPLRHRRRPCRRAGPWRPGNRGTIEWCRFRPSSCPSHEVVSLFSIWWFPRRPQRGRS